MKEELKEEKKKSAGLRLVIILLILVIIGMSCYIAYDKGYLKLGKKENETIKTKSDNNDKKETKKSEKLDIESKEVQELYYNANSHLGVGIDENVYNKNELKVSDMTEDYKMSLAYNLFKKDLTVKNEGQYTIETISEEKLKESYEKLFGRDTYKKVNGFKLYCANFKYNDSNRIYESITGGCGGTSGFGKIDVITSATKYEDRIEIAAGVVFIDAETTAMYKDFNKKNKIKDLTEDEMTNTLGNTWESKFGEFIKENENKVAEYTYTFKLGKDGSYYYTGVKNTK